VTESGELEASGAAAAVGGTSGIGLRLAEALVERGPDVVGACLFLLAREPPLNVELAVDGGWLLR
jgi:NAD(P)-dependent dehydrogenase (short-subunit alcohol dehydrogenase family)